MHRKKIGKKETFKILKDSLTPLAEKGFTLDDIRYSYIYAALKMNDFRINKTSRQIGVSVRSIRQYKNDFRALGLIEENEDIFCKRYLKKER